MFPTTGLFQNIQCPAAQDGSCDRPYCHFNHSLSMDAKNANSQSIEDSDQNCFKSPLTDIPPVYRPTPIRLLEQRAHVDRSVVNGVDQLPVYQPTPISELDRYAPTSIGSLVEAGEKNSLNSPSVPPTYSPVVMKNRHSTNYSVQSPTTPTYPSPFIYQPSPAYPPVTESEQCLTGNGIETPVTSYATTEFHSPAVKSDRKNIIKRKHKSTVDSAEHSKDPSVVCTIEANKEIHPDNVGEDEQELSQLDNVALNKRQKLLSLYKDLYGGKTGSNEKDKPTSSKSKASPILPYSGNVPTKPITSLKKSESSESITLPVDVPRPRAPLYKSDKIPMPIRTRYLDQFIEECLLIYESPQDAYNRALTDEQACHDKATSRMAYLNAVIQRLKSLKAEKNDAVDKGAKKPSSNASNSQQAPKYELESKTSKSENEQLDAIVQGPLLREHLSSYLLNEEQLISNGYPCIDRSPGAPLGRARILVPSEKAAIYSSCPTNERICCRCGARFAVDEFGNPLVQDKCLYHWSRPVKRRLPASGVDLRYLCCQAEIGQPGCQLCPNGHVHDSNKWFDCDGFVATLPPLVPTSSSDSPEKAQTDTINVYAIDCEMVYTTEGCELGRVTIVNSKRQTILDAVVRPFGTLIDCNTRFSGLQSDQLESSDMRLTDVQAKLLHLFDSETILVGHSLESDLVALKMIHNKVVDTSVIFPHREGPPKKRALRNLVVDYLHRYIQQDDTGHNSREDAEACLDLVQYQVKEDLRRGKWSI